MALFGRRKTTVGLDIGSGLIKIAVVDHGKGAPELVRVAITRLQPDAIVEGEVMDPGIVSDAIRAALDSANVKSKNVPDVESVELDFQILDGARTSEEMNVLLVAAKRDLVDAKMRILADAGVTPTIVDVDAFALHNAFEVNYPEAMKGFVGLVNIGNEITNVNIMDNGVPVLTRDLPIGTRRFSEDLQRLHGMAARDAENLIRGYDRNDQLDAVLRARGEEIAVGIERAAGFIAAQRNNTQLRAVYVCGGGSRTPGLAELLADRLRITVEHANPLARLNIRDGAMDTLTTDEVAPLLMLPIGLALRQ
jgi:type IV pilus assembly protein PilM